jgi:hypothetical protein
VHRTVDGAWRASPDFSNTWFYVLFGVGCLLALINFLPQVSLRPSLRVTTFLLRLGMVALLLLVVAGVE